MSEPLKQELELEEGEASENESGEDEHSEVPSCDSSLPPEPHNPVKVEPQHHTVESSVEPPPKLTSVQQKLAALEKLKSMKFGGSTKINPFSVSVSAKKELSLKESKELLDSIRAQKSTSEKNFPRKSPSPPRFDHSHYQRNHRSRENSRERSRRHRDISSQDKERPRSRNSHERDRFRVEEIRIKRTDSPTFHRSLPARAAQKEREFRPPLSKDRVRSLDFGLRDLRGESKQNLEDAFQTLLTLEGEIIDLWNQRSERLGLLKETLLREKDELEILQEEFAAGEKNFATEIPVSSYCTRPYSRDAEFLDGMGEDTKSSTIHSHSEEHSAAADPGSSTESVSVNSTVEQTRTEKPKQETVQLNPGLPMLGGFQLPPAQFPPPASLRFLLSQDSAPKSRSEAESHHLRLASFLARLPRVSSSQGQQPPSTSQAPPHVTAPRLLPSHMSRPGPPVSSHMPGQQHFLSPPRRPPGFPGLPPSVRQMGPRPPMMSQMFPRPTAPPKKLMELDTEVPNFPMGPPDIKRPRFMMPNQFGQNQQGRNFNQIHHRRAMKQRASGGRNPDEISEIVAVIPDDIDLKADFRSGENDLVHVIGSEDDVLPLKDASGESNGEESLTQVCPC